MSIARWIAAICLIIGAPGAWAFDPAAGGPALPIDFEVVAPVSWAENGGGVVKGVIKGVSRETAARTGELRMVVMGVNAKIDYDNVAITLTAPALPEKAPVSPTQSGFFLLPGVTLEPRAAREWRFDVVLPAGSREKAAAGALQLFVLYTGETAPGDRWFARGRAYFDPPARSQTAGRGGESGL